MSSDQLCRYPALLDRRMLSEATGLCWNSIQRIDGFPKPFRPGGLRALRWKTSDVFEWVDRQAAAAQEAQ